jgi:hypothetical protein
MVTGRFQIEWNEALGGLTEIHPVYAIKTISASKLKTSFLFFPLQPLFIRYQMLIVILLVSWWEGPTYQLAVNVIINNSMSCKQRNKVTGTTEFIPGEYGSLYVSPDDFKPMPQEELKRIDDEIGGIIYGHSTMVLYVNTITIY